MQNRMMITGAGSGLGREIALRWAREGWQLALSDVSEPGLQETLKLVREAGGDGFIQRCDVRDYSQLTAFAQACEEKLGGIDIIVNNAGVASGGFFSELSLEDWDWQIAINLMGVVKGCKAFLPLLEKSKGKIVNIASMAALMQGPAMSNYNVAKAGVVALSESLLIELAQQRGVEHILLAENLRAFRPEQPLKLQQQLAVQYHQVQRSAEALALLFEILKQDLNFGEAKKLYLDILATLPKGEPLASSYRRKLYSLLY